MSVLSGHGLSNSEAADGDSGQGSDWTRLDWTRLAATLTHSLTHSLTHCSFATPKYKIVTIIQYFSTFQQHVRAKELHFSKAARLIESMRTLLLGLNREYVDTAHTLYWTSFFIRLKKLMGEYFFIGLWQFLLCFYDRKM